MKSKILYLYPFVHINTKDKILLYNTLNGKFLITSVLVVKNIIYKLISNTNKIIVLESDLLENSEIDEFLVKIVNLNMGYILDSFNPKKLPIQFINNLKIQKEIEFLENSDDRSVGEEIVNYLNEVVIYLNGDCSLACKSCNYGYRQITTCKKGGTNEEIEWSLLVRLLNIFNSIPIETIHIFGGNLFKYSNLKNVISLLQNINFSVVFHINLQNLINSFEEINKEELGNIILNINVNNYNNFNSNKLLDYLNNFSQNYVITFIVESEEQLDIVENISKNFDQSKIEIKALYNEHNIKFFEDNVFINETLLLEEKHNLHEIIQKQGLNSNFFGSIIIDYTGEAYSNSNSKSLGNLTSVSIQEIIFKELKNNGRWRLLRQNVEPCSKCYYNLLCPSISNYEIEIGKFDLCNIKH